MISSPPNLCRPSPLVAQGDGDANWTSRVCRIIVMSRSYRPPRRSATAADARRIASAKT